MVEPEWISFTHLYIDFQLTWGHPGPLRVSKLWVDVDNRPYLAAEVYPFKQRVRWFRQCLKTMLREAGIVAGMEHCRPKSSVIQTFVPSVSLRWDLRAPSEVKQWISHHLASPCIRQAGVLGSLPFAAKSCTMQV